METITAIIREYTGELLPVRTDSAFREVERACIELALKNARLELTRMAAGAGLTPDEHSRTNAAINSLLAEQQRALLPGVYAFGEKMPGFDR